MPSAPAAERGLDLGHACRHWPAGAPPRPSVVTAGSSRSLRPRSRSARGPLDARTLADVARVAAPSRRDDQAAVGVDGDLLAGGDREHRLAGAGDQRDAERRGRRSRRERCCRCRPARCPITVLAQRGDIAGAEIVGHHDRLRAGGSGSAPGGQLPGPARDRPQVGCARGQRGIVESGERERVRLGGLRDRLCGRQAQPAAAATAASTSAESVGHHPVGLDDLGVGRVPVGRSCSASGQLGGRQLEPRLDPRRAPAAGVPAVTASRRGCVQARPHRGTRRGGMAADRAARSWRRSLTARSSAATMIAAEVAPGSWWPIERSPRYDARPLRASIGTVARMPSSAAALAAASASRQSARRVERAAQRVDGGLRARRPSSCRRAAPRPARPRRPPPLAARRRAPAARTSRRRRATCRRAAARCPTAGRWRHRRSRPASSRPSTSSLPGGVAAVELGELGLDGGEPAVHVRPVIGVADGGVELGEVVALLGDRVADSCIQRFTVSAFTSSPPRASDAPAQRRGVDGSIPQSRSARHRARAA